jgi:uncharacterized protein
MAVDAAATVRQRCRKAFYVSPFMDMDLDYAFRVTGPAERIGVGIVASRAGDVIFTAGLAGLRRELCDRALMRVALTVPAVTMKVMAAVHCEALRLWLKGMRYRSRAAAHRTAVVPGIVRSD